MKRLKIRKGDRSELEARHREGRFTELDVSHLGSIRKKKTSADTVGHGTVQAPLPPPHQDSILQTKGRKTKLAEENIAKKRKKIEDFGDHFDDKNDASTAPNHKQ
jgi:hypothetical protein